MNGTPIARYVARWSGDGACRSLARPDSSWPFDVALDHPAAAPAREPHIGLRRIYAFPYDLRDAETLRDLSDDRGAVLVALADDLVEVERLVVRQRAQTKIVDHDEVRRGEAVLERAHALEARAADARLELLGVASLDLVGQVTRA